MIYNNKEYMRLNRTVLSVSILAWLAMLLDPRAASCSCPVRGSASSLPEMFASSSPGALASNWALMLVAMMLPTLVPAIYQIRLGSFVGCRARSTAFFLTGYGAVWMLAGGPLIVLGLVAKWLTPASWLLALAVALVWQASPFKQQCLNRCHSHRPLPAFGFAADCGATQIGFEHGLWCVASCWIAMLLPMLMPISHFFAMAAVSLLMFCERLDPPRPISWRWRGFAYAWRFVRLFWRGAQGDLVPPGFPGSTGLPR